MKPNIQKLRVDKDKILISGGSVTLRIARPEDAEIILKNMDIEAVQKFSFFTETPTMDEEREFLGFMYQSNGDLLFVIEAKDSQEFVGTIGLHEVEFGNETARLGIILFSSKSQGRGFAGEAIRLILDYAFYKLKLHKIYLNVFATNEKSRGIYKHLGFIEEGISRKEYKLREKYHDLVRMSVLREEWKIKQTNEEEKI